jgi:ABC-type amino acid transport substrate-binding protein
VVRLAVAKMWREVAPRGRIFGAGRLWARPDHFAYVNSKLKGFVVALVTEQAKRIGWVSARMKEDRDGEDLIVAGRQSHISRTA